MNQQQNPFTPPGGPGFVPPTEPNEAGKGKAIAALVLGICALVLPIPFLDVIMGVVGIVLAVMAKKEGYTGGMATAGLVLSIIGTVSAVIFTFSCGLLWCAAPFML